MAADVISRSVSMKVMKLVWNSDHWNCSQTTGTAVRPLELQSDVRIGASNKLFERKIYFPIIMVYCYRAMRHDTNTN